MRKNVAGALALAFGVITLCVPLLAHHGTAAFENEKKVALKGTVTEWLWSNPHCLLQFDVKGDDGKVAHWIGETQNPVTMTNVGWSKSAIKAGDEVTAADAAGFFQGLEHAVDGAEAAGEVFRGDGFAEENAVAVEELQGKGVAGFGLRWRVAPVSRTAVARASRPACIGRRHGLRQYSRTGVRRYILEVRPLR